MDEYMKASGLILSALLTQLQAPDSFSLAPALPNEAVLLTEKTTVTLSNIEISVKLFFVLLEKTRVAVGGSFSITEHADSEDCIREHSMARNSPVCFGRNEAVSILALENIKRMPLNSIGCSLKRFNLSNTGLINILPKLRIHGDCKVESLRLTASEEAHVAEVLAQEKPFFVGRVKSMLLEGYAASVITKMKIHEDNTMESFVLDAGRDQLSRILKEGDNSIKLGRIKRSGFYVPEEIRRKLRYTLVDGENISIRHKAALFVLFLVICFSYYHWLAIWFSSYHWL
ncbi:MAG: uncharacterized protein A8A55_3272 [Amphiamblys sp. WSBS2006]|nr:MAG: uncharacterized protein A8A55_3272 [Amphiamblys sp. WSBS2006]